MSQTEKSVLKFQREEGGEVLMARALYVEGLDDDDEDDDADQGNQPPTDGMSYLRMVIKVGAVGLSNQKCYHILGGKVTFNKLLIPRGV